jgi:hypothetical protein
MKAIWTTINKEKRFLDVPLIKLVGIAIIMAVIFVSTLPSRYVLASGSESESLSNAIKNFTQNLEDEIRQYVSKAESPRLPNGSNIASSQVVTSNNNSVVSFTNNTGGNGSIITK